MMSEFFEPPPRMEEEPEPRYEWEGPPEGIVAPSVAIERVVSRNEVAAVYLASITAFLHGFTFDVFVTLSSDDDGLVPFAPQYETLGQRTGDIPDGKLRVGFAFGDGSKAMNTGRYFGWYEDLGTPPPAPLMTSREGEGRGMRSFRHAFWVWPLPPPGRLEFVCEWPAARLPLTRVELDADAVIEAASRGQEKFPAG